MNNKRQIAIAIGIMCILLTFAIVVQLNTIKAATKIVGTAYAEQSLKDEVLRWKENYESLYDTLENANVELERARQEASKENARGKKLEEELTKVNRLLGLTELTGSGVIVTLSDNTGVTLSEIGLTDNMNDYIIHDDNLIYTVNELFNAGAEAISINGQRIISTTAITCSGTVISVNGVKLNSPFVINAIGNPESLFAVDRNGGELEYIRATGALAEVKKSENITVDKYTGTITSKYMTNAEV